MILFLVLQIEWQAINRRSSDSLQELIIDFVIPNQQLKFIFEDSNFYARYESQLKIYDRARQQLTGDYWRAVRPRDSVMIHDSIQITIPPESDYYTLRIVDLNGGEIFNASGKILSINYLGNIRWSMQNDTLVIHYAIFNKAGQADSIFAEIGDLGGGHPLIAVDYDDSLLLSVAGLKNDDYQLKFFVYSGQKKIDKVEVPVRISRSFFLDDAAWSLKISQLEYIATPNEMGFLRSAAKSDRDSLWHLFWKQYDPTPNTEYNEKEVEYFGRIEYCEKNFSHGDKGWRSDRAKIYVKWGQPDEIQSRPYEVHSYPYEIWLYYRMNRKYIFVDEYGFGEYILTNPQGSVI